MSFAEAIRSCISKYAKFSGRASRSEFWWFALFVMLGNAVFAALDQITFGMIPAETGPGRTGETANGPFAALFSVLTIVPYFAVGWRRMHDSGRSGLHLVYPLIAVTGLGIFLGFLASIGAPVLEDFPAIVTGAGGLVPVGLAVIVAASVIIIAISPLLVLWWLIAPSQPGPNPYGPNPHEET